MGWKSGMEKIKKAVATDHFDLVAARNWNGNLSFGLLSRKRSGDVGVGTSDSRDNDSSRG